MRYYEVSGVKFSFAYKNEMFYKDNLEKYEIEKCVVNHHVETLLVDEITLPKKDPDVTINDRKIYVCDEDETVIVFQNDIPVILVEKKHDYSTMYVYIKKDIDGIEEIEYVYTGIVFMELCLYHSIQSLHGSAIQVGKKAVIFSAPSGVGKSTHVDYWKKLDQSITIINDDKPLLSLKGEEVYVSGSPWSGKTKQNKNVSLPLHSIVFLEQGTSNQVRELNVQEKVVHFMRNINRPRQDDLWRKVEHLLDILLSDIPMYKASVTNSIESVYEVKKKIEV